jgi:MerR family transcriptional regulator, thiopeptide resistance regulator
LGKYYKIHEFAKLAGVTVKALHHYDRLGLLQPGRTEAGYRVYCERDLETLEQIVALKFLGIPLKQIGVVLKRAAQLPDALRLQRRALEEKHALLGRAIKAIQAAEDSLESGQPADTAILKKIIEVIDMQNDMQDGIAVMKKYYSEEAWERHRCYYEEGPSPEWRQLYRDTEALLGTDPGNEPAQALVERWFELSRRAYTGDPEVQTDSPTAWMDREHWPPVMKQRLTEFKVEECSAFIKMAALSSRKQYFSEKAWAKLVRLRENETDHSRMWQARVDLFADIEKALLRDPAGEIAQALVARWRAQVDEAGGGDPEIKTALLHGWANRRHWPPSVRWQVEALHMMSFERFERAADFLDRAAALGTKGETRETIKESASMTTVETCMAEFDQEMANSRKMLERVPENELAWKPHEKSFTLGKLANHVAAIPVGITFVITGQGSKPSEAATTVELIEAFDQRVAAAREAIAGMNEGQLAGTIMVNPGVTKTRAAALR